MNMASELVGPQHVCRHTLVAVRSPDSEPLLQSPWPADNIMAIFTHLRDRRAAVDRSSPKSLHRRQEQRELPLRKLESTIRTELNTMPIEESIMDHEVIGLAIRQGRQQESLFIVR